MAFLRAVRSGAQLEPDRQALAGPRGDEARCLLVDLPDRGRSPWNERFSYRAYAGPSPPPWPRGPATNPSPSSGTPSAARRRWSSPSGIPSRSPNCASSTSPEGYGDLHRFTGYISAMRTPAARRDSTAAPTSTPGSSRQPDPGIRAFLLQNLRRRGGVGVAVQSRPRRRGRSTGCGIGDRRLPVRDCGVGPRHTETGGVARRRGLRICPGTRTARGCARCSRRRAG